MELEQVKLQTTWNDAAGSINSNYAKIADAIAQLKANGGGGGGGADIDLTDYATKVWVEAQGYITASALTPYLKTEDAEETYATKDFVNNKLTTYATIDSVTAIRNTLTGQIGAVGASVEQLAATKLDSSYFTLTNIKSTLGISDWALVATKPSYAWSEINSRPTALSQFTDDVVAGKYLPLSEFQVAAVPDPSTVYLQSGIYRQNDGPHLAVGTSGWSQFITLHAEGDNWAQMYFSYDGRLHYRTATFGDGDPANIPWTAIITEKNIGNYNAGSADILATSFSENINYTSGESSLKLVRYVSDWESNGFPVNYSAGLSVMTNYTGWQLLSYGGDVENPYFRSVKDDGVWKAWRQLAFLTDNVASATKLATRHKLWGKSFDGTEDVSGNLFSDIWRIIKDSKWDGTFIQSANYDGTSELGNIYMTAMHGSKLISFNVWANNSKFSDNVTVDGNVGIGTTSPTERLDVSGNIKASGNINATSITINGVTITASSGTITVNGNVFAKGDITGGV